MRMPLEADMPLSNKKHSSSDWSCCLFYVGCITVNYLSICGGRSTLSFIEYGLNHPIINTTNIPVAQVAEQIRDWVMEQP